MIAQDCLTAAMHTGAMSPQYNPGADSDLPVQDGESAGSARAGWRVCAIVLLLFIAAAALSAMRKDLMQGFDEVAHASYVAHLQHNRRDLACLRGNADARSLELPLHGRSQLSQSSLAVLLAAGPARSRPAVLAHRLINVAFAAIGLAALMAIGLAAGLPRLTLYAYVVPLACIPVLAPLAGAVNNDNAAFAGGAIATLAAFQLLATGSRAWLLAALGGVMIASWAKFTALLLAGGMVGGVLLWLLWRGRLPSRWTAPIAIAALLAGAPYMAFVVQYGSPTPATPGEIAMIEAGAHTAGWDSTERLRPLAFAMHFVSEFVLEWMPTLKPRNAVNYAALAIPIAAALCALAGIMVAVRRIARGQETPLDIVIAAGALAFAATFLIHGIFGYRLHAEFGWLTTAYPRYYLPLAALLPLAGLALLGEIRTSSIRAVLLVFLIVGPVLFRLLGEPLG
jgi:hypothetical protein